ncbi:twin-arginine translocation signal domain-containing protein [Bradyrhizobium septentrionale]|uniref:Twin-arginine translocation signal domain-containing protein n=1 Tax=Bradyrhizobium septentrionale TaxID=1404411 RepID=A0A973W2S6_9BRAD|nr:twin-arginine translocation signal domain-containing protein [Bradyrhizobium septentrionale]UGY15257.1 twin-arginine translocation signal domain-containing protein [Bradyrhizobium septentrionale]UGY23847.1 twin-arginine translocation signal domain-containing protein [Bradyrhizobium septentrionale]
MTTRRDLFKVGAAAAAAVALPSSGPVVAGELVEPAVAVAPATPYATYPWRWWISLDGESFIEEFDTEAEAIKAAKGYGEKAIVAECQQQDFSLHVYGSDVIEMLYQNNEEDIGDGEFFDCTKEQSDELGQVVTAAIEAWAAKHKLNLTAWTFGQTRNRTEIPEEVA